MKTNSAELMLMQGKYNEIERIYQKIDISRVRDEILTMAYETESICVYDFVQYMIYKTRNNAWREIAIEIMVHPLSFVEGAYSVALFHARELLKSDRSIDNLEKVLFFHEIPENLVERSEALSVAREILDLEPDNKIALAVVNRK